MIEDFDYDDDACSIMVPADVFGTPGMLVSITAAGAALAEDPTPPYNNATTYAAGVQVHSAVTHRVYESAKDNNVGHDPTVITNQVNAAGVPTWWIDITPTNKYAAFDGMISSPVSAPSPLVITLAPGAFNGFALFGLVADSYSVDVLDAPGGNVIYSEPLTALDGSQPDDYYEYFFAPSKPLTQFIRSGITPYSAAQIKLTLNKASGNVKLGMFAVGDLRPVGIPQRDASVTPEDFSYFKRDGYGNTRVEKRNNATGMSITTKMEIGVANQVLDTIKEVLGVPCVVVGSEAEMYEWLTVFGLISAEMSPPDYPYVTLKINVKGFI